MKLRKRAMLLGLALVTWISSMTPMRSVEAGERVIEINQSTFSDPAVWNNPEDDVLAEEGKLAFTKDCGPDSRFISKSAMNGTSVLVEGSIKLNQIPKGERFIMGFGLKRSEAYAGDQGNVELYFLNDGGIKVGVSAYEEEGEALTISEAKACGVSLKQNAEVKVLLENETRISVTVNGKSIFSGELPYACKGRIGFLQSESCKVEISKLMIQCREYDRPENTTVFEDFEGETWDLSQIKVSAYGSRGTGLSGLKKSPGSVGIQEYNGSNVLMLRNCDAQTYFSTQYQYSNFEMTFDVPFIQKENVYDENGAYVWQALEGFAVFFGVPVISDVGFTRNEAFDKIIFNDIDGIYSTKMKKVGFEEAVAPLCYLEEDKPFSVKVSVVDGDVTVGMKWVNEAEYRTMGSYTISEGSPLGHVQFYLRYNGSMALDNIKVVNLDENPNLVETEFKSGLIDASDAVYEPFERVYVSKETVKEASEFPRYYLLMPVTAVAGGLLVTVSSLIAKRKKKYISREGEHVDED